MTLVSSLVVTAVVWTVSMIPAVRWRAFVYSLPLPITAVLVTNPVRVDGSQLIGVAGLVSFLAVVALAHHRLGWHIAAADLLGVGWYVAVGATVAALGPVPVLPALGAVCALWVAVQPLARRGLAGPAAAAPEPAPRRPVPPVVKLLVVFAASLAVVALGGLLAGLVVTFPYAGVLVAVESRRDLVAFSWHFAVNSLGLVAYLAAAAAAAPHGRAATVAAGWLAFAACAALLHAARSRGGDSPAV